MAPNIFNQSSQPRVNHELYHLYSDLQDVRHPTLVLNEALDNLSVPYGVNEQTIENFLRNLTTHSKSPGPVYWLMTARLFELALICAGHYADNCEFSAAGDLLVNPRKVLIHRKGYPRPLVKHRHGRLTEQLNQENPCREFVPLKAKHDVTVEVAKGAILPSLFQQIEQSSQIAAWYLNDAQERMKKIADTIGFLSAWSPSGFEVFHHCLQKMSAEMRRFVADHQCNFDTRYFKSIGREISRITEDPKEYPEFLL
jgi:hypothetical protein